MQQNILHPQMDPAQQQFHQQQQPQQVQQQPPPLEPPSQQQQPQAQQQAKKRKKTEPGDEVHSPSEPRRLRRSHEACARCRSKKIKCDSKHPRCTACTTAGAVCQQEDRHRQTLTPRGHTERVEQLLAQCDALLKRHLPGFQLEQLDEILVREGIDPASVNTSVATQGFTYTTPRPVHQQPQQPQKPYVYPPQHYPGYPIPMYPPAPYPPPPPHLGMQPPYNPHIHPAFQPHIHPHQLPQPPPPIPVRSVNTDIKGQDPQSNDMSSTQALAKVFGVSSAIVADLKLGSHDKEDLAVGSSGLSSGRDRDIGETSTPRDPTKWVSVTVRRNSTSGGTLNLLPPGTSAHANSVQVWLPKDRNTVKSIVDVYFSRLNIHRPVFARKDFDKILDDLYDGHTLPHDPGFVCSLYLVLALGTLSELNHRAAKLDNKSDAENMPLSALTKKLMTADWPEHDEFFERALSVKPDLRVTISSLQALILLHWYLYTERQGRTLWRLAGSLVRLSIELGLHHDPTKQQNTFTPEEMDLRIRLWGIVMVHDRGTSILLGRPLAISPSDSSTPHLSRHSPSSPPNASYADFSEHFLLSHPIADIQADIITSLYTPQRQSAEAVIQHATRIIRSMAEFRRSLPDSYKFFFTGTQDWPVDRRIQLMQEITEDQGLTLLKLAIARILLLRALFSAKDLPYQHRHKALLDAISTSHNIIIVHAQLIRFPDIGFFTSPIPLHIAAMVILYGQMSRSDRLSRQTALEDIWLALDMLPRFRWRWERKDFGGEHPLIAKLAERVMEVRLSDVGPPQPGTVLLPEEEWDEEANVSVGISPKSQQTTPTLSAASYTPATTATPAPSVVRPMGNQVYGPPGGGMNGGTTATATGSGNGSGPGTPPDHHKLVEVPTGLFYPFYPEAQVPQIHAHMGDPNTSGAAGPSGSSAATASTNGGAGHGGQSHGHHQDYTHLLAVASQPYGYQGSADSFMSEERDPDHHQHGVTMWMNVGQQQPGARSMTYAMPPQS